jgi:hypothetical protein
LNSYLVMALDWWTIPREETRTHLSYVASNEGKGGLEELKEKAFIAAAAAIMREHFGITVEASESMIEDTGNSKYQFFTKIKSDPMIIKGLKLTDLKILEAGELTRVLVRVEISKEDLSQAVKGHMKRGGTKYLWAREGRDLSSKNRLETRQFLKIQIEICSGPL